VPDQTPPPRTIRLHLRIFLLVLLGTFLILAVAVALPGKNFVVKSSIEVASGLVNDRWDAIEPIDQVAKQISSVYASAALLELAQKGVSISDLGVLQNFRVEPVGRSIVLSNFGSASLAGVAKEFQELVLSRTIKDRAALTNAIRAGLDIKIETARRTFQELNAQSKAIADEIEESKRRSESIRVQLATSQSDLSSKFQRTGSIMNEEARAGLEAEIRELRDQISIQQGLAKEISTERSRVTRDLADIRGKAEEQARITEISERDKQALSETRTTLAPSLIPLPLGRPRLYFFLAAFAVSILLAFGTVVLLNRFDKWDFHV
jgi:hypothetical protein